MPLWRSWIKGVVVFLLLSVGMWALWYGSVFLLLGSPMRRLLGLVMVSAAFRGYIAAFDLMWGRPARWSKDPMVRAEANRPDQFRHH